MSEKKLGFGFMRLPLLDQNQENIDFEQLYKMPAYARPALENWQKSYENGEYLRSAEMAEEQNYSMIDGRMNNMAPRILPPGIPEKKRQKRKRRSGKLPLKDRESVLKRLKEYQEELGRRGGQTVPGQEAPELQERRNTP